MQKLGFLFSVIYFVLASIFLFYAGIKTYTFAAFIAVMFLFALLHFFLSIRTSKYTNFALIYCMISTASVYAADLFLGVTQNETKHKFSSQAEQQAISATAARMGIEIDARTKDQVITDLRKKGIDAVPFIPIGEFLKFDDKSGEYKSQIEINSKMVMPLNGIGGNRPVVACNERGDWWVYEGDRYGYNNPDQIWSKESIDILFVGDSYPHGACLSGNKAFPDLIRKSFPSTLNLGWGSSGPLAYLANIIEYGRVKKPKIVVFCFFEGNDLVGLEKFKKSPLINYIDEGYTQNLVQLSPHIDAYLLPQIERKMIEAQIIKAQKKSNKQSNILVERVKQSDQFDFSHWFFLQNSLNKNWPKKIVPDFELFSKILQASNREVSAWGGRLIFLYLPAQRHIPYQAFSEVRLEVPRIVKELNIEYISALDIFAANNKTPKQLHDHLFSHMSEEGHKIIADELGNYLRANP